VDLPPFRVSPAIPPNRDALLFKAIFGNDDHVTLFESETRRKPSLSVTHDLLDVDYEGRWVNLTFGVINLVILIVLVVMGITFLIAAIGPPDMTSAITGQGASVSVTDRMLLLAAAGCSLGAVKLMGSRFEDVWQWSRLPAAGELIVNDVGITLLHPGVLTTGVFLPWPHIQAIAFDTGRNHDTATEWRRFPLLAQKPQRNRVKFLFATDGPPVPKSVLIATRPTPPNMVIVLKEDVTFHNPNTNAIDVVFPMEATEGMPSRPPHEQTNARIVFVRAKNPGEIRRSVSISGKVHPIRKSDLPGLFLDRIDSISNTP
jgi:hypothetical protein